jgi:hypothetical protein
LSESVRDRFQPARRGFISVPGDLGVGIVFRGDAILDVYIPGCGVAVRIGKAFELPVFVITQRSRMAERIGHRDQISHRIVSVGRCASLPIRDRDEIELVPDVNSARAIEIGRTGEAVHCIVNVSDGPSLGIGIGRNPAKGVIGEARSDDIVGVDYREQVAEAVIFIGRGLAQRVCHLNRLAGRIGVGQRKVWEL